MQYFIESRDTGPEVEEDVCLVSTRWVDLGPGLTAEDVRWRFQQQWMCGVALTHHEIVLDRRIRRAITAQRIISDDITCITKSTPGYLVPFTT